MLRLRRSISIVIPAYNEQNRLGPVAPEDPALSRFVELGFLRGSWWVNDGFPATKPATSLATRAPRVLEKSRQIAARVTPCGTAMLEAKGDWVLYTDADLSSPIEELEKLWAAGGPREGTGSPIGSRAVDRSLVGVHQPLGSRTLRPLFSIW